MSASDIQSFVLIENVKGTDVKTYLFTNINVTVSHLSQEPTVSNQQKKKTYLNLEVGLEID